MALFYSSERDLTKRESLMSLPISFVMLNSLVIVARDLLVQSVELVWVVPTRLSNELNQNVDE